MNDPRVQAAKRTVVERPCGLVSEEALAVALHDVDVAFEQCPDLIALEIIPVGAEGGGRTGAWVAPITLPAQLDVTMARNEAALKRAMRLVDAPDGERARTLAELHAEVVRGGGGEVT
jgi:hypothetical protein